MTDELDKTEAYLDPDSPGHIDVATLGLIQEMHRLRASAKHYRDKFQTETRRADELQRRLNEKLEKELDEKLEAKCRD